MRRFWCASVMVMLFLLSLPAFAAAQFGMQSFEVSYEAADGSAVTQAGSHPFALNTTFELINEKVVEGGTETFRLSEAKTAQFEQIAGLIGSTTSVPACPYQSFSEVRNEIESFGTKCENNTAVGYVNLAINARVQPGSTPQKPGLNSLYAPVFNVEPPPGVPAALGFSAAGLRVLIDVGVKEGGDHNIVALTSQIPQAKKFIGAQLTVWGVPGDPRHNSLRGTDCLAAGGQSSCPFTDPVRAFLTMPRACGSPLTSTFALTSWAEPLAAPVVGGVSSAPLSGCGNLTFEPTANSSASNRSGSPSGLDLGVDIHDEGLTSGNGLAQSDIETLKVTLPPGFVANPSVATGLRSCSEAELARDTATSAPGAGCNEASKIGTVSVETPLLKDPVNGSLFLATPFENPFHSLFALYLVLKDPAIGVDIKQPVQVSLDADSGQIVAVSSNLPQIPFSHLQLSLRSGPRAPLTTPAECGSYDATAVFSPRAGGSPVVSHSAIGVSVGPEGGSCSAPRLTPSAEAGTTIPLARKYSPFVLNFSRPPGSSQFGSVGAKLPRGLLGKLAGVSECGDAQIAAAAARSLPKQGQSELAAPSCPSNSAIGSVLVGAGSGDPTYVRGRAYLAGPYKGAQLSIVVITPAIAGPFDLGNVVIRNPLYVDPITTQIRTNSDPLPRILDGIPLDIRTISVLLDRDKFTLNPSNCDPKTLNLAATSITGQFWQRDQRFQVGGCNGLPFRPKLRVSLAGATKRTGNPALTAVLTQRPGEAGISSVTTLLPKSEFIDNAHISNPCTRVQFNENDCPSASILGSAVAYTPLLDKPLKGTIYFRSNGGERELPDIVVALRGQIDVTLVGFIDSVRVKASQSSRVRTRFATVPDAPVSRFVLKLKGGKRGLLENSADICQARQSVGLNLIGQNGTSHRENQKIAVQCGRRQKG